MTAPPRIQRRRRRAAAFVALGVAVAAVAVIAFVLVSGGDKPAADQAARRFVAAWNRGDDAGAARVTDRPAAAAADLTANRRGLDGAAVTARVVAVNEQEDSATARLAIAWDVPGIGRYAYRSTARLRRGEDDAWTIAWTPKVVHARLSGTRRLGTTREAGERGNILDRDGDAIVRPRTVYRVGLQRDKVGDIDTSVDALAEVVDINRRALARAVRGAGPKQFVEAIALRESDYRRVQDALDGVPGALAVQAEAPLAESRGFARALLGGVGPATAEQLDRLGDTRGAGDQVGQSGLQARFESRLGATAAREIVVRENGVPAETLYKRRGSPGRALRTTLDIEVQQAAEEALGDRKDEAALVAVQPSTGDILAVANRPADSSYDRALEGRYPPGSTFKVITTAALLRDGLRTSETVDCPRTITVGGRSFKNFEGSAQGAVPFAQDFAQSCNTAFVSLTERLPPDALRNAARDFGLGKPLKLGMPAADSQVPPGSDLVARAATMIGQDKILASPLAMAGVAATLADGRWHAPRLLAQDPHTTGTRLAGAERDTLRALTRDVVTQGTGTALASTPGEVHGKSGTAEYGGGDPPPTHAWFIAYRGDVALAVLVENGRSGGTVAAPVVADFFAACDRRSACD
jgi:cell division protein FtsI/penicillin-binding protein 2